MAATDLETEVERNFAAFQELLPELLLSHAGKFAVMHDGAAAEFFDTVADAVRFGRAQYGDMFSVQEVTARSASLGYYSYAVQHLPG